MIQEIFPHRFNNHYQEGRKPGEQDFVLHFKDNSLLLKADGEQFGLPRKSDFPGLPDTVENVFLFTLDDVPCFLIWDDFPVEDSRFVYREISFFRTIGQPEIAWISLAAFHLRNWYLQNRFCGKCGAGTRHKHDERALVCSGCQTIVYPRISPAIIVAIISNDKILLARNANFTGGWYSLVAGYVDVGETLEEALAREVKEEVGLDVRNIRYYKSQPWPLSGSMMMGFIAEADENQPVEIDNKEIVAAEWFTRGSLPAHASNISIAGEIIEKFEKGEL
jgi:NAD+ diphosphatase